MTDKMRIEFEEWYAINAFDYAANPIGSRECGLQWGAWQAARTVPDAILEIGRRLIADTKDNDHYTSHPMFRVEKRSIVTGIDTDYTDNIVWIDEDGEILDPEEAAPLEAAYDETMEVPDGYTRTGYAEEWEHVDTYLTPQAAEARINGGKDGRVNVGSAYRNSEMRTVREFLMSLAAAPEGKK